MRNAQDTLARLPDGRKHHLGGTDVDGRQRDTIWRWRCVQLRQDKAQYLCIVNLLEPYREKNLLTIRQASISSRTENIDGLYVRL
jgi:hypothetical protein